MLLNCTPTGFFYRDKRRHFNKNIRLDIDKIGDTGSYNLFTSRVYFIICERWEINCRAKC